METYLGILCRKRHEHEDTGLTIRYAKSKSCVQCNLEWAKNGYAKNREHRIQNMIDRYKDDREERIAYQREYYQKNKEAIKEKARIRRELERERNK